MRNARLGFLVLLTVLLVTLLEAGAFAAKAEPATNVRMPGVFTDNMVLQRGTKIPVWGWADPRGRVTVTLGRRRAKAIVEEDGTWKVHLKRLPAGGPHELNIEGAETLTFGNVLIGDVWVCSGQSNMVWWVKNGDHGVLNRDAEVATADYPEIRLLTVPSRVSFEPQDDVEWKKDDTSRNGWLVCSPETVGPFSAVGYFFGRELHQHLDVPIGLILSAWGGTLAEAWTSEPALSEMPDFVPKIEEVKRELPLYEQRRQEHKQATVEWSKGLDAKDPGIQDGRAAWAAPDLVMGDWVLMQLPCYWEEAGLGEFDGFVWFRKDVAIPEAWAGKDLELSLGPINDMDKTWFNGTQVGAHEVPGHPWVPRKYTVPGSLVQSGTAVIAVRVYDMGRQGGIYGKPELLSLNVKGGEAGSAIALAGPWRYKVSADNSGVPAPPSPPYVNPNNPNLPSVLYNGMIAPVVPYGIRGAIWYQGESNASRAYQYRTLFPRMIRDWREKWGRGDFPFVFVQLANWQQVKPEPDDDAWAELREAQTMTLSLPNTGMAVTIDIGEADNIHPQNKQDVGRRLALAARHVAYGERLVYSGPMYDSMRVEGGAIRLEFDHVGGGLVVRSGAPLKGFAIAGSDRKFVWADAKIDGDTVVVWSDQVPEPVAVRYAWAINPVCNLYNTEGLPASPFRTDDWPGMTEGVK